MNFHKAIKLLSDAENELLHQVCEQSNYDDKMRCLDYSKSVHDLCEELARRDAQRQVPIQALRESNAAEGARSVVAREKGCMDDEFPVYFVFEEKLWKVARRGNGSESLYKKSFSFNDVQAICSGVRELFDRAPVFSIADLEPLMQGVPVYKLQITVMALVKAGCLKVSGRGKYSPSPGVSISERRWIDGLLKLPVHPELLDR